MKIKIIDLLNKIYNHEDMPGKIVLNNRNWLYDSEYQEYFDEEGNSLIDFSFNDLTYNTRDFLNTEVKIIEENKKIRKLSWQQVGFQGCYGDERTLKDVVLDFNEQNNKIGKKINELVEEVNKLKENKI